jgi:hypothetical protein
MQVRKKSFCYMRGTPKQIADACNSIPTCKGFAAFPSDGDTYGYLKSGTARTLVPRRNLSAYVRS